MQIFGNHLSSDFFHSPPSVPYMRVTVISTKFFIFSMTQLKFNIVRVKVNVKGSKFLLNFYDLNIPSLDRLTSTIMKIEILLVRFEKFSLQLHTESSFISIDAQLPPHRYIAH